MGNLWLKIKIWTKVAIAGFIALYLLVFIIKNNDEQAKFWYWYNRSYTGSLLFLVLFTFLIGGLAALLATTTFRTIRQIRELRAKNRSAQLEREVADMRAKAAMLQTKPLPSAVANIPTASLADTAPPMVNEQDLPPKP